MAFLSVQRSLQEWIYTVSFHQNNNYYPSPHPCCIVIKCAHFALCSAVCSTYNHAVSVYKPHLLFKSTTIAPCIHVHTMNIAHVGLDALWQYSRIIIRILFVPTRQESHEHVTGSQFLPGWNEETSYHNVDRPTKNPVVT